MKDIMGLPTIGKKRAEQIINSREENGQFSSVCLFPLLFSTLPVRQEQRVLIRKKRRCPSSISEAEFTRSSEQWCEQRLLRNQE